MIVIAAIAGLGIAFILVAWRGLPAFMRDEGCEWEDEVAAWRERGVL